MNQTNSDHRTTAAVDALASLRYDRAEITCTFPDGKKRYEVWGWLVGPFVVWDEGCRCCYNVTHLATGYKASGEVIDDQARALVFAARLARLGDWSFTDPDAVKAWPADLTAEVIALRAWASDPEAVDPFGLVKIEPEGAAQGRGTMQ